MENDEAPEGAAAARAPARRRYERGRDSVPWSKALASRICERLAAGELLYDICEEAGMPTPQSVGRWARERPKFGEQLAAARAAGGRQVRGGGVWTYSEDLAAVIFERLCDGESLTAIGKDPAMPCLSTLYYWRRRVPGFAELLREAKEIQAERLCEAGWEMALGATPETAYLTDVRLKQLRWMAGTMAPRTYRIKQVEPEAPREVRTILVRRFGVGIDPETGEKRVVAYHPNPETGEVECAQVGKKPGSPLSRG